MFSEAEDKHIRLLASRIDEASRVMSKAQADRMRAEDDHARAARQFSEAQRNLKETVMSIAGADHPDVRITFGDSIVVVAKAAVYLEEAIDGMIRPHQDAAAR